METNVNSTLKQRGTIYGDYEGGSVFRASMMDLITRRYRTVHGEDMSSLDVIHVYDIVNKLSRLAVTPDHIDTWHDIAGYALLVEEALNG